MYARPKPAAYAVSLLTHGIILAWVASGPGYEQPKSLYAQVIAPHASKLIWYDFRDKLPDVSPTAAQDHPKLPRADVRKASQTIVAASAKAPRNRQFVWQPAPKLELHTDLQSPNVLAVHVVRPEPPPKPRLFVPPPETPAPVANAQMLAAPPEIHSMRNLDGAAQVPGPQIVKAPARRFEAPQTIRAPDQPPAPLPEAPAVSADAHTAMTAPSVLSRGMTKPSAFPPDPPPAPAVSVAIVGLNPAARAPTPPEGSRAANFAAGTPPHGTSGTDTPNDGATLSLPGLSIHSGTPDNRAALVARIVSPTSEANLRAALRGSLPAAPLARGQTAAVRVSSSPDPLWIGRVIYAMSIQMPNVTSYSGSWMIWYAERNAAAAEGELTLPAPLRKVDPKYFPAAIAEGVEGTVRLAAIILKNGRVASVRLLRHLDDRLDQSAQDALDEWQFEPALRNGQPVDIDVVVEVPFRLAPRARK
jgi:TonB family protein